MLRQICNPIFRFFRGFDFAKSSSLLSGALEAASWVLFGARLKIPDPNPSAKDYPRDITVIVDFFSFASFHIALPADGPHPPHVRFVFSIFLVLSLPHVILSYTMLHHICNYWPATLWRIGEFSVKITYCDSSEMFSHRKRRRTRGRAKYKKIFCSNICIRLLRNPWWWESLQASSRFE